MTDTSNLVFLPWVRRGGTTALAQPDSLTAEQPGVATATASHAVNDAAPIPMDVRLIGPGHVSGLQVDTKTKRFNDAPAHLKLQGVVTKQCQVPWTAAGRDALARSAAVLVACDEAWAAQVGPERWRVFREVLEEVALD